MNMQLQLHPERDCWPCTLQLGTYILIFLRREINKGFVEVTGGKVNSLEVPCIYRLYGPHLEVSSFQGVGIECIQRCPQVRI